TDDDEGCKTGQSDLCLVHGSLLEFEPLAVGSHGRVCSQRQDDFGATGGSIVTHAGSAASRFPGGCAEMRFSASFVPEPGDCDALWSVATGIDCRCRSGACRVAPGLCDH